MITNLISFLRRHKRGYSSPWLQVSVLAAVARDGMEPVHAFALRGKVLAASPIHFEFRDSNLYLVFFTATEAGSQAANGLAETMRDYARESALPAFGVSVLQGECLAQMNAAGRLAGKPAGKVIADVMRAATEDAASHE